MAVTGVSNYNSVYENTYATSRKEATKKEEAKETAATQKSAETAKKSSNDEYLKNLQKQFPNMKLQVGYGVNTKNDGKVDVLNINPKLLEKMQNDPKAAKEYTQRLKDVDAAHKYVDSFFAATGSTVVCRHAYLDENGNYSNFTVSVRKDALNEKLRKETQENAEKRIEKSREKARENAEQLAEKIAEKAEKADADESRVEKAENLLADKLEKAEDGKVLLDNDDIQKIIEASKEQEEGQMVKKQGNYANVVGENLDMKI